jgi:hypothetical protein
LDRGPEPKTLRRKLARLGTAARSTQFGQALAEQRVGPARERLWISTTATVRMKREFSLLPDGRSTIV